MKLVTPKQLIIEQLPLELSVFDSLGATGEGGIELMHKKVAKIPVSAKLSWLEEVLRKNFGRVSRERQRRKIKTRVAYKCNKCSIAAVTVPLK